VPIVLKSESLNLLEPSGPVKACNGIQNIYIYVCILVPSSLVLQLIVVRRFVYASDPESYTSGNVATGRASLAGQVKG
jgi:hypothetical protein